MTDEWFICYVVTHLKPKDYRVKLVLRVYIIQVHMLWLYSTVVHAIIFK